MAFFQPLSTLRYFTVGSGEGFQPIQFPRKYGVFDRLDTCLKDYSGLSNIPADFRTGKSNLDWDRPWLGKFNRNLGPEKG
jgi:hypothetical protein